MTTSRRVTTGLLLPAILCLSTLQAADTVAWDDLPKKIGEQLGDRDFTVVTKTGEVHHQSQTLRFTPTDVSFTDAGPSIPREQVTEIRIRHRIHWKDDVLAVGTIGGAPLFILTIGLTDSCIAALVVAAPLAVAVGLAAAPFVAVIDAGRRHAPAKVIRVAP